MRRKCYTWTNTSPADQLNDSDKKIADQILGELQGLVSKMPTYTESCITMDNEYSAALENDFKLGNGKITYPEYVNLSKQSNQEISNFLDQVYHPEENEFNTTQKGIQDLDCQLTGCPS